MGLSFLIFDDFLQDPDAFRAQALKLDYPVDEALHYYSGKNSRQRLQIANIDQRVSQLVGEPLEGFDMNRKTNHHGRCRLTLDGEEGLANVHVDNSYWSGILFLTKPEHCQGGTDFFTHKETGTDSAPLYKSDWEKHGFKDASEVWEKVIRKDTNNRDAWERSMRVPMRYNRLVLLKPHFWHAPAPGFGSSLEDGRLVYLLFFNHANMPAQFKGG